jgi:tetratricopeptide (TPR) repeat protein
MADGEEEGGHLTAESFEKLERGELAPAERARLGAHLRQGCPACRERLTGLVVASLQAPVGREDGPDPYEFPVARACARFRTDLLTLQENRVLAQLAIAAALEGRDEAEVGEILSTGTAEGRWAWCEALVEHAEQLRTREPAVALGVSEVAVDVAESLREGPYPVEVRAELQARAWMEFGNLLRASAGNLAGAERALDIALVYVDLAGAPPALGARLGDLLGSLYRDQRRFAEAHEALHRAAHRYLEIGERHLAGRTLINKATALRDANEPERALEAVYEALGFLDWSQEPTLILTAVHNAMIYWTDLGRPEKAWKILWRARPLYQEIGTKLDRVRLLGVEGLIAAAQGRLESAEGFFRQEKEAFEREELAYDGALVALDLAEVLLRQGRSGEVLALVDEMIETFARLRIGREAIAAVVVLRQAVKLGEATAAQARHLARELNRLVLRPPPASPEE